MIKDFVAWTIRLACGVRLLPPEAVPKTKAIYFANHSSHLDFATIWACLPKQTRRLARPVAGKDYWDKSAFRRWLAQDFFNAILIERRHVTIANNPLQSMLAALDAGESLIVFPEGTRSQDGKLHEFKSGLHHVAAARPEIPLVPVYLQNLNRILPKGDIFPVPLLGSLIIGKPITVEPNETKPTFLQRARQTLQALAH